MTERKDFKKVVRDRKAETGETYTAAHAALSPEAATPSPLAPSSQPARSPLSELVRAAFAEARRLGHSYIGPEHGLLGILNGPADDVGRRALVSAGMTADLVEAELESSARAARSAVASDDTLSRSNAEIERATKAVASNAAWHKVQGRAEGFGAAMGTDDRASPLFILGVLWDSSMWLRFEGQVPRERVIAALRNEGVAVPASPPPVLITYEFTQKVDVPNDDVMRVVEVLKKKRDEGGPRFGMNFGDPMGFVASEDGIDLQAIVDEVLATPE